MDRLSADKKSGSSEVAGVSGPLTGPDTIWARHERKKFIPDGMGHTLY